MDRKATDSRSLRVARILVDRLSRIRDEFRRAQEQQRPALESLPSGSRASGHNLVDYVTLRRHDLRPLQRLLHNAGMSSLGHAESHVREGLNVVIDLLDHLIRGGSPAPLLLRQPAMRWGKRLLRRRTLALLGLPNKRRNVRIMVTMPSEAASDPLLIRNLLLAGMDCMRINCAHDGADSWLAMITHLRAAQAELGLSCRVLMDLAGPKLRTGPVRTEPAVRKIRPDRDAFGRLTEPAHVTLEPPGASTARTTGTLYIPVAAAHLEGLQTGDELTYVDARGKPRKLTVVRKQAGQVLCESWQTAYITPGMAFTCQRDGGTVTVSDIAGAPGKIVLQTGDTLVLDKLVTLPGTPATFNGDGTVAQPARIGFTLPEALGELRRGQPVFIDDGKIAGVVETSSPEAVTLRITLTRPGGSVLRADKGVNLPETEITLPTLNAKDREHLAFAIQHADLVGLSFVRSAKDVGALFEALRQANGKHLGVILKIETRQAVVNLPDLLLTALRHDRVGLMIARGDLAIECDFRRMAELQEEILWFCEAAHVPVIWATEVLAQLAKTGMPTRAEITDAAMAERAECVMLNKGPYILEAIHTLDDILRRMAGHQHKKMARMRPLRMATLAVPFPVQHPPVQTSGERLASQP